MFEECRTCVRITAVTNQFGLATGRFFFFFFFEKRFFAVVAHEVIVVESETYFFNGAQNQCVRPLFNSISVSRVRGVLVCQL